MTVLSTKLPKEVSALVHHVELNKAGWWNKTLDQLVLATIWLSQENPNKEEIREMLKSSFELEVGLDRLDRILSKLDEGGSLIRIPNDRFRIPKEKIASLEDEIRKTEEVETSVRDFFNSMVDQYCPALDATDIWSKFERDALLPMIKDIGANTYRLVVGEIARLDNYLEKFTSHFESKYHEGLRELIVSFMSGRNNDVRSYITRMLHAQFCVESSGLSDGVIRKFKDITGKSVEFRLFVDTNFLFSLMNLHDNPSNLSASDLKDLLSTLGKNPKISLHIIPNTISEAKGVLSATKSDIEWIPSSDNFTGATLQSHPSGIIQKFFTERKKRQGNLTADDWFDPYIKDFITMAQGAGITLFREKMDGYKSRQEVVDDIKDIMEYEEQNSRGYKKKSYEAVEHDVILWHLVKDKRPHCVETPAEARDWILTVDFRFINFDKHKSKHSGSNIPLCIHPTSLIQLLQFWVPRSDAFEEAVLGVMRLPFLFREFDAENEKLTLRIINKLGHYEDSKYASADTIFRIATNEGLRSRIKQEESENGEMNLVKDELIEQLALNLDTERTRAERAECTIQDKEKERKYLERLLNEQSAALQNSNKKSKTKERTIEDLKQKVSEGEKQNIEMRERLHGYKRWEMFLGYFFVLIVTLGISSFAWRYSNLLLAKLIESTLALNIVGGALWISIFMIIHLIIERYIEDSDKFKELREMRLFNFMKRNRKNFWMGTGSILLGWCGIILTIILSK